MKNVNKQDVIDLAKKAGDAIMDIYQKDFAVYDKSDASPLTEADLAAHHILVDGLERLTDYPVLSEESSEEIKQERLNWNEYWLIDPLDGTKEFVKKNGEFTVNVAFIKDGKPTFGVVYAPALDTLYVGDINEGAYKQEGNSAAKKITVKAKPEQASDYVIVGSRSHQSDEFKAFIADYPGADIVSMGSSLKLCLVAEGKADIYPRLGLTCEWDTGAAHAVVEAAGGKVLHAETGQPLKYNKEDLLNPFFIVK
ncbi:3'(2'),5'-bisphosphate nucleotidase CysQ [Marinomonas sp.]|nr:3'(2'),5'-bisphosphate nucleotidase CysQ [Marinomonas sp.]MDB4837331.1 3'(2'),5'-bisphosphate nucleotidase CysQ [Marinomonas sp.]